MTVQEGMFYRIGDFAYARNAKQAVGFYLFHLLIGCIGFMLAVLVYGLVVGFPADEERVLVDMAKVATFVSMLYVGYLNYRLLEAKGLLGRPKYLLYAVLGVLVAMMGMLLGLVSAACFSILRPAAMVAQDNAVLNEEEQP